MDAVCWPYHSKTVICLSPPWKIKTKPRKSRRKIMTQQTTQKTIQKITRKIVKGFHPQKIILFGSRGWGKPRADSDIDFFIVKESKQRRIDRERAVRSLLFG